MKITRLTERDLNKIVKESVKRIIKEAEDGGWVVDSSEAQEAYDLAVQEMGEETINSAIVRCLGDETLAQCLAYIFRQYDFRQWKSKY
jgi:histone H3/H4